MALSYTAGVEEKLDEVAEGGQKWVDLLGDFYASFKKELDDADKGMLRPAAKQTDEKCPLCGKPMLLKTLFLRHPKLTIRFCKRALRW